MTRTALLIASVVVLVLATAGSPAAATSSWHLSGGGTADISQVAVNVRIEASGDAKGSFMCLMAGRSAFVLPPFGLAHIMAVHATPTSGEIDGTVVSFVGSGHVILDGQKVPIEIEVWVDVATETFQLTIVQGLGAEVSPGVEHLETGQFSLR
jgi:hypothetical protein